MGSYLKFLYFAAGMNPGLPSRLRQGTPILRLLVDDGLARIGSARARTMDLRGRIPDSVTRWEPTLAGGRGV